MGGKGRPFRSKLIPYLERIRSMRKGGSSYAEIAEALNREYGLDTHRSTVHDFVRVRAKGLRPLYALPEEDAKIDKELPKKSQKDEHKDANVFAMLRKVAKEREAEREEAKRNEGRFDFDETRPIR